ncbi:MAG: glycosyltransferase family 2 protein, partial [Chlamydiae bacterium]|nr:glycosyltransferase family 2 protein [Chlamydiota bacterium]
METLEENVTATVIIPTFQRPQFVMRAIKSVLTQTYPHFKLHIYDNHSGDETEKVVRSFNDPRIIYHCREKNIGYIRNINEAFKSVDTPLFCFFCDDDWIQPENLEILVKLHQENPSIGVACGIYNEIDLLGNEIVRSREPGFFHAGRALPHEVNICGSVIKSSVFKKVG